MNKLNRRLIDYAVGVQDERERQELYERMAVCFIYIYLVVAGDVPYRFADRLGVGFICLFCVACLCFPFVRPKNE